LLKLRNLSPDKTFTLALLRYSTAPVKDRKSDARFLCDSTLLLASQHAAGVTLHAGTCVVYRSFAARRYA